MDAQQLEKTTIYKSNLLLFPAYLFPALSYVVLGNTSHKNKTPTTMWTFHSYDFLHIPLKHTHSSSKHKQSQYRYNDDMDSYI